MMDEAYGAFAPGLLDKTVMAITSRLPDNWLGLRLAIGLRRIVSMRLGRDGALDVERWGLKLRLYPRRNGCEKNLLFTPQMYEAPELAKLSAEIDSVKLSQRDFVFVDIGANAGLFSFFVASYAGTGATILAVEPASEALSHLRFNLAANPGAPIRVLPFALGGSEGRVAIEINDRDMGGTWTRPWQGGDRSGTPSAECFSLLDVLKREQVTYIDGLKIDVEGAEDTILIPFFTHAPNNLWPTLIIIEDGRNSWKADVFSALAERDYKIILKTKLNVVLRRSAT
jgi:FkbM family methyltransferase